MAFVWLHRPVEMFELTFNILLFCFPVVHLQFKFLAYPCIYITNIMSNRSYLNTANCNIQHSIPPCNWIQGGEYISLLLKLMAYGNRNEWFTKSMTCERVDKKSITHCNTWICQVNFFKSCAKVTDKNPTFHHFLIVLQDKRWKKLQANTKFKWKVYNLKLQPRHLEIKTNI